MGPNYILTRLKLHDDDVAMCIISVTKMGCNLVESQQSLTTIVKLSCLPVEIEYI